MKTSSEDWINFRQAHRNRQPTSSPSSCSGEDVAEFSRPHRSSGSYDGRSLNAAYEYNGGNRKENPFWRPVLRLFLNEEACKVFLFAKILTPSDVGQLKRLVVPTRHAEKHFPAIFADEHLALFFEDDTGKSWRFMYSYENNNQSYVLTIGWNKYLKEKRLAAGDVVFFHRHRTIGVRLFIGCRKRRDGAYQSHSLRIDPFYNPNTRLKPGPPVHHFQHGDTLSEAVEKLNRFISFEGNRSEMPTQDGPVDGCVLVVYYGEDQDTEETYFLKSILNELRQHGVAPLAYPLTRQSTENIKMLYQSRCGIIIFSKNYNSSTQMVDEFVKFLDYKDQIGYLMVPVYFDVSPSDIMDITSSFWKAFSQLGTLQSDQLRRITSIKGYQYTKGDGAVAAKEIVKAVSERLWSRTPNQLTGIGRPLRSILSLVHGFHPLDVGSIGIWGMAGIGKTTIAREIFSTLAHHYDVCYFLQDFDLMCQAQGLSNLRNDFFSTVFGEATCPIDSCDIKPNFIRDRFLGRRALVVLDGVRSSIDAQVLVGGFDWFSGGHTIILTSRNRHVLVQCGVKELYKMPELSKSESLSLFSQYSTSKALKSDSLASDLVDYSSGIPLIIKELHKYDEKEHLKRLRHHPPTEIQDAFQRSYNRLGEDEKNVFLDLACFFRGENKDEVIQILDGCGFYTDLGICGLVDESLISIVDNKIEMPNFVQDMGRFVVREENKEPGKRTRLWAANDIAVVLTNNSGTEAIEVICLDVSEMKCELNRNVFERMYRLRLLKLYCSTSEKECKLSLPEGLYCLPDELKLLHWECYPLNCLPRSFNPKYLVELNLPRSLIEKLWRGTKNLEKLKKMRMCHSRYLIKLPKLSKAGNLEHMDLEGCTSLAKISSSIRHLHKLVFLNLKDCSLLHSLPSIAHLEYLEVLNLSGCSELEDIQDFPKNLKELYLAWTAISEMPLSIENLDKLVILDLENCKNLRHLPLGLNSLKSLTTVKLSGWSNLDRPPIFDASYQRGSEHRYITQNFNSYLKDNTAEKLGNDFGGTFEPNERWVNVSTVASMGKLPSSISHSLMLRAYGLGCLFLYNSCSPEIPTDICRLTSLKELDLGGNGFKEITESIKQLSKLHALRLRRCKNLVSVPELPQSLELLDAHGCASLESFLSFAYIPKHCIFSNCFNLSQEAIVLLFNRSMTGVEQMVRDHQQGLTQSPVYSICVPTSAAPTRDRFLSVRPPFNGPSVELLQYGRYMSVGFWLSLTVSFADDFCPDAGFGISCIYSWRSKKGICLQRENIFTFWDPKETVPMLRKDHTFLLWDRYNLTGPLWPITFEFRPFTGLNISLGDSCEVKHCKFLRFPKLTGKMRLGTKRAASALDPEELSLEKEMLPQYKRVRLRRVIESVILEIRKTKRKHSL